MSPRDEQARNEELYKSFLRAANSLILLYRQVEIAEEEGFAEGFAACLQDFRRTYLQLNQRLIRSVPSSAKVAYINSEELSAKFFNIFRNIDNVQDTNRLEHSLIEPDPGNIRSNELKRNLSTESDKDEDFETEWISKIRKMMRKEFGKDFDS